MRKVKGGIEMFPAIITDDVVTFTCRGHNCAVRMNEKGYWEANIPDLDDNSPRWFGKHRDAKSAELWVRMTLKCETLPEFLTPRQRSQAEVDAANRRADVAFIDSVAIDPAPRRSDRRNQVQSFDIHEMLKTQLFGKTGS